jgi:hypothetical protein
VFAPPAGELPQRGIWQSAQGCEARATLGIRSEYSTTLMGLQPSTRKRLTQPRRGWGKHWDRRPRVASRTRQPWAEGHNPVRIEDAALMPGLLRMPSAKWIAADGMPVAAGWLTPQTPTPRTRATDRLILSRVCTIQPQRSSWASICWRDFSSGGIRNIHPPWGFRFTPHRKLCRNHRPYRAPGNFKIGNGDMAKCVLESSDALVF